MSSGSSWNVAAGAPLEVPPPVELPTAGVMATGLVTRLGGDTLVPATEIDSPTATGRTEASAATGAGEEPVVGVAVGVAVAVIALAVAAVTGTGAAALAPNTDTALAAGVPTVEVPLEIALIEVDVGCTEGAMLPPVWSPGPAPDGSADTGATVALVADPLAEFVCANTGADAENVVIKSAAPPTLIARIATTT